VTVLEWLPWLQDFDECQVKHGVRIHIYNICRDDAGNPSLPVKLSGKKSNSVRWMAAIATLVVLLGTSLAFWLTLHRLPAAKQDAPIGKAAAIQPRLTLTYYFSVRPPNSKDWKRYSREMIVPTGYYMQFHFASSQAGHLYILNEGPEPVSGHTDFNTLLPSSGRGSSVLNANQELRFPSGAGFVLDRKGGVEKPFIVWSSQEIAQLEELKKWVNQTDAGAVQGPADLASIQDFLEEYPGNARADEQADRTVLSQNADPLLYVVKLEHL